jgi:hypothetical protein
MQNRKQVAFIVAAAGIFLLIMGVYGFITTLTVPSDGTVGVLQTYWDAACTNRTDIIHWGTNLAPDSVQTKNVWIKNYGGASMNLTMVTENWNPANATDYLSLTWDREHYTLGAGGIIQCNFTLTVFANVTESTMGPFSVDIVIDGTW